MDTDQVKRELGAIVGTPNVLTSRAERTVYSYDASVFRGRDLLAVVFPDSAEEIARLVTWCNQHNIPYIARGAGTAISGGSISTHGGIMIELSHMNRILEIDLANGLAVVEPGVINQDLKQQLATHGYGYTYVPDPGSQVVSTIGGNVSTNAGGMHCLKYGITSNHILGLEVVLPNGDTVQVGGKVLDQPGADLTGLLVGSEGTLGIITKIIVRLLRLPEAVITQLLDQAMMRCIDQAIYIGYPDEAGAALIIELDGLQDGMQRTIDRVAQICKANDVLSIETAETEEESARLWFSRRAAFGAMARLATHCYIVDGCVPRTKLPDALRRVIEIGERHGLTVVNLAHAGDGNLHPGFPFNKEQPGETERVLAAGREILEVCVEFGGSITGEHGVGLEKQNEMSLMYSDTDLEVMRRIKLAHDPADLCNPKKIFPLSMLVDVTS